MTMSPAHGVDTGMEEIAKNIRNPTIRTCFDVQIGKRSAKIWDDDIKSKGSLKRVSQRLVGKKKPAFSFSHAASRILGCESKKDAKFCVVCGALFILGTALLIVLGFEPVKITVVFEGGESRVIHVAQRKQKRISKARILTVHVEPLHPVLDHDRYSDMCSKSTIVGDRKLLTVTFSKVTLEFLEDKIGVLCHCGKKMSRSSLETHLRPSFGPFKAAIKERSVVDIESVSFNDCVFSGGRIKRVADSGKVCNTWLLRYTPTISGTFEVNVNTKLVNADTITLKAGVDTLVHLEGNFVSGTQAKESGNCMIVSVTLIGNGMKHTASGLRLPLMQSHSLLTLNRKHFPGFVGPIGQLFRPNLHLTRDCSLFQTDTTLNALVGRKLVVKHGQEQLLRRGLRLFRK